MTQTQREHPARAHSVGNTHPGRVRKQNQDTIRLDDEAGLWIIADGMGGNRGGEIASALACEFLSASIAAGKTLEQAIRACHQKVLGYGDSHPEVRELGTTLVLSRQTGVQCELAWVGDSRIYLWRDQRLVQMSREHSVVQRMLDGGLISPVQAQHHPQRNLITSCLGGMLPHEMEVGLRTFAWQRDDLLLLCSDGLTDELDDEALRPIFERDLQDDERVEELIQQSLAAGGRDNVSVVLVRGPLEAPVRAPELAAEVQAPVAAQPSAVQEEEPSDLLKAGVYALLGAGVAIMLVGLLKWLR